MDGETHLVGFTYRLLTNVEVMSGAIAACMPSGSSNGALGSSVTNSSAGPFVALFVIPFLLLLAHFMSCFVFSCVA